MQDLYLGEDGNIWRKPWDRNSPHSLVELPKESTDGAMTILRRSLGCWFDCFEDLQRTMGMDLRDAVDGRSFVSFCEGGAETFGEHDEGNISGMFVKMAGSHCARHFPIASDSDSSSFAQEEIDNCLAPIGFWISGVPVGAVVMIAIVGIPPEATAPLLEILDPLGVPALEAATSGYRAFAAVGKRPDPDASASTSGSGWFGEKRGNARPTTVRKFTWPACHASRDVAYASIPLNML